MTSTVWQPPRTHSCGVNAYGYWADCPHAAPATVRRCDACGTTWVAERRVPGCTLTPWRREGRFERWRRERKAGRRRA